MPAPRPAPVHVVLAAAAWLLATGPAAAAQPFRALGTEPFWSATLTTDALAFDEANAPGVTRREAVKRHQAGAFGAYTETATMKLWAMPGRCSDGMSDRIFPTTVVLVVGDRRLDGCGGDPVSGPAHP